MIDISALPPGNSRTESEIRFVVPFRAVGKQSMARNPKTGLMFLPKKSRDWMKLVSAHAAMVRPPALWTGALSVTITSYFSPGIRPYTSVSMAAIKCDFRYPDKKPDSSNIAKGVEDAITGIIWKDDCQVVNLYARKRFGEVERTEVCIIRLTSEPIQPTLIDPGPRRRRRRKK